MNRLQLDFSIQSRPDRVKFAKSYLENIRFTPTEAELDMIAKYILWGKDPSTGLNGRQEGLELETRYKTWDSKNIESLDALIETPGFSEAMLRPLSDPPTKIARTTFSRTQARKDAPSHILDALELLWREIDETELLLNFYDIRCEKRTSPPREALLSRFSPEEQEVLRERSTHLKPYAALKLKHKLVDLRNQQYTYKDCYAEVHQIQALSPVAPSMPLLFDADFPVYPLGLAAPTDLFHKIFRSDRYPEPNDFNEDELREITKILWSAPSTPTGPLYFDFCDSNHLYELFGLWNDLEDEGFFGSIGCLKEAATTYRSLAQLDPILDEILEMKIEKYSNQDIADAINEKYGKKYRANYISTLYCKKCLGLIAAAAKTHREVMENIFFPENFKKCKDCGRVLLLNEGNFVRRIRSNDGFSPRCKRCEKIKREKNK